MTIWVLIRTKALVWKNSLLRQTKRERLSYIAFIALGVYLACLLFQAVVNLFALLQGVAPAASQALLTSLFSGIFTFALFWGLGTMLGQLYLSSDLELLLAAPIPPSSIYLLKLLEGMQTLFLPALLSLASLIAYGVALHSSWGYYLLALFGFFCLLVLVAALAMAIIMLVVRLIPVQRAREIWALAWTLVFGLIWTVWMIFSNRGGQSFAQLFLSGQGALPQAARFLAWSPAGWLAQMLVSWQARAWPSVALNLGLLTAGALAAVALAYAIYQRAFYLGWTQWQEIAPRHRPAPTTAPERQPLWRGLLQPLPQPVRAIVIKEWTTLPRDLRQLSGLFFPIVVAVVYVYLTVSSDVARQWPEAATWMAMAILPLVPLFMTMYYTIGTIGLEGEGFALLRVAPLPAASLLWGKFWASFGPTWLIAEGCAILVALWLKATAGQLLLLFAAMTWFSIGFVAIAIGTALWEPNFKAASARRATSATATYLTLLLHACFWVVNLAAAVWIMLKLGPLPFREVLAQLIAFALPQIAKYLHSPLAPLAIVAAEIALWIAIGALWRRGIAWLEKWEITALD